VPLPFFHSVAAIALAHENAIAGNIFPYTYWNEVTTTLIGSYSTVAGGNGNGATDFLHRQCNSYGAYGILTEFV